jgi:hypothetical protein
MQGENDSAILTNIENPGMKELRIDEIGATVNALKIVEKDLLSSSDSEPCSRALKS